MRNYLCICAYIVTGIFSLLPQKVVAQNESGSRYLHEERFKGIRYWYDSSTAMYQVQYPIIRNIPPISPSMPLDMLLAYVIADSLCRFAPQKDVTHIVNNWGTLNDTLRYAGMYLYKMLDYNPIIFTQYQDQVTLLRKMPFQTNLRMLRYSIMEKYSKLLSPQSERNAVYTLLGSDYILRVQVIRIDSMQDKFDVAGVMRYRVTAKVLDTLKGQVYQPVSCYPNNNLTHNIDESSSSPCMYFQYATYNYFDPSSIIGLTAGNKEPSGFAYEYQDSAFMRSPHEFAMQPGQEAIIFMEHTTQKFDYENDYYDLQLMPAYSYNALPIIGGQVRDVNNVWSSNLWMSYADWKTCFLQLRDKILHNLY